MILYIACDLQYCNDVSCKLDCIVNQVLHDLGDTDYIGLNLTILLAHGIHNFNILLLKTYQFIVGILFHVLNQLRNPDPSIDNGELAALNFRQVYDV